MRPEHQFLLSLCRLGFENSERDEVQAHIDGDAARIDWGCLIEQACYQNVMPMIGWSITTFGLGMGAYTGEPAVAYPWLFEGAYAANSKRNATLFDEYRQVVNLLAAADIPYAIRKGPVLAEQYYPAAGARRMNDMDVLVSPKHCREVAEILAVAGYQQGAFDYSRRTIRPMARRTQLFWRTYLANLPPFLKVADRPLVPLLAVDVTTSIRSTRDQELTEALLSRRVATELMGGPCWRLNDVDNLIDVCLHLHKEATTAYYLTGKDIQVSKFNDVWSIARTFGPDRWSAFERTVHRIGVRDEVYYALHFTSVLHEESIPEAVLAELRPAETAYLDQYATDESQVGRWQAPFLERLFDLRRCDGIAVNSAIPTG